MQRERDAILAQQEETRHKMAALIDAVSTSKLDVSDTPDIKLVMTPPEAANHQERARCALSNSVKFFECEGRITLGHYIKLSKEPILVTRGCQD